VADKYDFLTIEPKWQARWHEEGLFATRMDAKRPKFYYLDMFPYPSGDLHMGHVRNYIIGDTVARFMRMRGYNVLHPMGWDAFGLPAENAAIQRGIHPKGWTEHCITEMKKQFDRLGISYDWSREISTCEPEYYRWSQWLFLKLFEAGLAYKKLAPVNWCPTCATVLANEQVVGGRCERCDTVVELRELEQWFFATTKYADRLLDDLELLDEWPERVRVMQRNWIGRSEGVEFDLQVEGLDERLSVFTTRIDTVFGITYMVLAPEHPLIPKLVAGKQEQAQVLAFCEQVMRERAGAHAEPELDKKGIFTGAYCINPVNNERVPIWVANYVLMEYGTGAIMAVPAHDQRDFEFAREYGLPIRVVIEPEETHLDPDTMGEAYVEDGVQVNCGQFDGVPNRRAMEAIGDWMEQQGIGRRTVNYRLRDWCISRQRYWGAPIPIVYCDKCGLVPVPEDALPVLLPTDVEFTGKGGSPLTSAEDFVNTVCPRCGAPARRETDTMDTFVDSSWYFLRFASPDADDVPFRRAEVDYWLPVDKYVGGIEHAVMHLYYARFITKVLADLGVIGFVEPFRNLFTQGMIYKDGAKMSKSKGNVVTPDDIIDKYGADTGRLFILFVGPPEQDAEWSDQGVEGCFRFLGRLWRVSADNASSFVPDWRERIGVIDASDEQRAMRRKVHQTLRRVTEDIGQRMHFNTAVAALMELVNDLTRYVAQTPKPMPMDDRIVFSEAVEMLTLMLSPMSPHISDELRERLGLDTPCLLQPWPQFDEDLAAEEEIIIVVQVNGKIRDRLQVAAGTDGDELERLARASERVQAFVGDKTVRKVIVVPNKLVNIVAT